MGTYPHWEASANQVKLGVISDTHDRIRASVHEALAGADIIVHAGDICNANILWELESIAPVRYVLGNNDNPFNFPENERIYDLRFDLCGLRIQVGHIERRLDKDPEAKLIIVGHTHVPKAEQIGAQLIVNPGSATRARGAGHTVCRITLESAGIVAVQHLSV